MTICVNGFPKSGTHALLKSCELLGQPAIMAHVPYGEAWPSETTQKILIIRDPRNAIISWLRMQRKSVTVGTIMAEMVSRIKDMSKYVAYLETNIILFRFEDLIKDDIEIKRLAEILDVPYIQNAFEDLPGYTITWSGNGTSSEYSDYTKYWNPELISAWSNSGGDELISALGYGKV